MGKLLSWPKSEQAKGRPAALVSTLTDPPMLLLTMAVIVTPLTGRLLGPVNTACVELLLTDTVIPPAIGTVTDFTILGAPELPSQVVGLLQSQAPPLNGSVDNA